MGFELHPVLARDTVPIARLPLSSVRLMDDANWVWVVLVPERASLVEIVDLAQPEQHRLMDDIAMACAAIRQVAAPDKLNVAALGNQVPQLHVHVVARHTTDPAWPRPIWGAVPRRPYEAAERDRLVVRLREALAGTSPVTTPSVR